MLLALILLHQELDGVRSHIRDNPVIHLTQLCEAASAIYKQALALQTLNEKHENEVEVEGRRITNLEHIPGAHLVWKIDNYKEKLNEAKAEVNTVLYSPPFLTARYGYKLVLLASLNGDGKAKHKFMSVFVSICRGEHDAILPWPFSHNITLTVLNQADDPSTRKHVSFVIKPNLTKENEPFVGRPKVERNPAFGAQNFVALNMMDKLSFVKDDCIFIKVDVDVEGV